MRPAPAGPTWRRAAGRAGLVLLSTVAVACGHPPVSRGASGELAGSAAELRAAAAAHDDTAFRATIAATRASIAGLVQRGEVTGSRAEELLVALDAVEAQTAAVTTTTVPRPTTTTTAAPAPAPAPDPRPKEDPPKGKGKGKDD